MSDSKYSLADCKTCIYDPSTGTIHDVITPDGNTAYGGHDAQQYAEQLNASIWDFEEAIEHKERRYITLPKIITSRKFHEMLEVLPPVDWQFYGDVETFKMSERLSGNITGIYCRIGDSFFSFNDRIHLSHDAIVKVCRVLRESLAHPVTLLTCCCCGNSTLGRQWWNRDTGYGLCARCSITWGDDADTSCGRAGVHRHIFLSDENRPVSLGDSVANVEAPSLRGIVSGYTMHNDSFLLVVRDSEEEHHFCPSDVKHVDISTIY